MLCPLTGAEQMPNWTTNRLIISGAAEEVARFVKDNEAEYTDNRGRRCFTPLSFAKCVPEPAEPGDGYDWYRWRNANWGTKWDATGMGVRRRLATDGTLVEYWFMTAWEAPEAWMDAVRGTYRGLDCQLLSSDEDEEHTYDGEDDEQGESAEDEFWRQFYAGSEFECVVTHDGPLAKSKPRKSPNTSPRQATTRARSKA